MEASQIIFQALSTDPTLSSLLGNDSDGNVRVYTAWHDSKRGYPQVTITMVGESSGYNGDNIRKIMSTPFQVDIWTPKDPTTIKTNVRRILGVVGTNAFLARPDQYYSDDKLHRVVYQTTINQIL